MNNIFFVFVVMSVLGWVPCEGMAEEQSEPVAEEAKNFRFKTVTTKEGFNFNIPEDMPIETRAGITGPIPFNEYIYFKFKKVEERLGLVEKKIDELEKALISIKKFESEKQVSSEANAGILRSS